MTKIGISHFHHYRHPPQYLIQDRRRTGVDLLPSAFVSLTDGQESITVSDNETK
jgi:hypothetical protein